MVASRNVACFLRLAHKASALSDQTFLSCATDDGLSLGGYYRACRPLGFRLALFQERHCSPSCNTPSQYCLITNASGFCKCFYGAGSLSCAQPPNWRARGITLCLASTLRPFKHGWPYQKHKTPADIALGVTETSKLPHHDKVVTPFGAETGSHYSQ